RAVRCSPTAAIRCRSPLPAGSVSAGREPIPAYLGPSGGSPRTPDCRAAISRYLIGQATGFEGQRELYPIMCRLAAWPPPWLGEKRRLHAFRLAAGQIFWNQRGHDLNLTDAAALTPCASQSESAILQAAASQSVEEAAAATSWKDGHDPVR